MLVQPPASMTTIAARLQRADGQTTTGNRAFPRVQSASRDARRLEPMRIAVVALGKIGLPLAVQFADPGHEVIGVDVNPTAVDAGQRRHRAVPGRGAPAGEARRARPGRPPPRDHRLRRGDPRRRRRRARRAAVRRTTRPGSRTSRWMDAATRSLARAPHPGHARLLRDDPAGRHDARPLEADARGGLGPRRGHRLPPRLLARAGAHRPRLRRPAQVPEAHRRALAPRAPRAPASSTRPCSQFDERPDLPRPTACGTSARAEAAEMAKLAETTYRDVNIGLANQFALFADRARHRRLPGHRGVQLAAVQPHPPPGHRRRRPLHPRVPAAVPVDRPRCRHRPHRAAAERLDARARSSRRRRASSAILERPARRRPRRGLPRRRQGDGVLGGLPDRRGARVARRRGPRARPALHR